MCGICGAVNFSRPERIDRDALVRMTHALGHRGPDDAAILDGNAVILGHTRLSIIDAIGGVQPMATPDNALWIVFNGEIFNHIELRDLLTRQGHRFCTRSDTEVILEAYRAWGPDLVHRLNGQWAFAIWDRRRGEVLLARDPFGIRPLYYAHIDGTLLFASEIKALMSDPRLTRAFRPEGIAESCMLWAPRPDDTVFEGVR